MSTLTTAERRIVRALAETAIPVGVAFMPDYERLVDDIDAFLTKAPFTVRTGYRAILAAIEIDALRTSRRAVFSRLDVDARRRAIEVWHDSPHFVRRVAFKAVILPMKVACFATEASHKFFGFPTGRAHNAASETPRREERPGVTRATTIAADATVRCQVVVVGTGAGGAVVAKELAERGVDVVMVEEGAYFTKADFNRRAYEMSNRMYRGGGLTLAVGIPGIPIPLGRSVGGTTTINSGTCFRVPERTLADWRNQFELHDLTADALAPLYERVEAFLGVEAARWEVLGEAARLIRNGADALGYSHGPLMRNAPGCEGSGVCCFGCPSGAKRSTDVSYVPAALAAGARLLVGARALRVDVSNGRTVGVSVHARDENGERRFKVSADRVVIAAGSLITPTLLHRSGVRSPWLGRNLSIHPATRIAARFAHAVNPWDGIPQGYCIDEFADEGILFEGAAVPPDYAGLAFPFVGARFTEAMEHYRETAIFGFMVHETSRGRVFPSRASLPLVVYNLNKKDAATIQRGLVILARVFFAAGAERLVLPVHGFDEMRSPSDIDSFAKRTLSPADLELGAFHPLGTARMGTRAANGVVRPDLETFAVRGLYVVDGSIFPTPLGVNPQLTIMAFATRAAATIAAALRA